MTNSQIRLSINQRNYQLHKRKFKPTCPNHDRFTNSDNQIPPSIIHFPTPHIVLCIRSAKTCTQLSGFLHVHMYWSLHRFLCLPKFLLSLEYIHIHVNLVYC